jgi:hypothetical protein
MLCASLVYIDSLFNHNNHFDRSCGHLCACALAVLTQHGAALERGCNSTQTVLHMACDLLWSACASAEVLGRTTGLSEPLSHLSKVVASAVYSLRHGSCSAAVQWVFYKQCSGAHCTTFCARSSYCVCLLCDSMNAARQT